jgi:hypothetical protein
MTLSYQVIKSSGLMDFQSRCIKEFVGSSNYYSVISLDPFKRDEPIYRPLYGRISRRDNEQYNAADDRS